MNDPNASDAGPRPADATDVRLDLRGGGWVLVVAGLLVLGLFAWRVPHWLEGGAGGDPGFDLSGLRVERELVVRAAPRDGLPALVDPPLLSVEEAEALRLGHSRLLVPGDRVVGVVVEGEACAYPLSVLTWHEVVNHTLGGRPLAVTYSALGDAVRVFDRRLGEETLELGVSGLLYQSNLLLYDRRGGPEGPARTESLWSQLQGRAVSGPAAGARLEPIPAQLVSWQAWKAAHPETRVLGPDLERGKLYKRDPYATYSATDELRFPVDPLPPPEASPALKDRVLAVRAGGAWRVYPVQALVARAGDDGAWEAVQEGVPLRFEVLRDPADVAPPTVWVEAEGTEAPLVVPAYWFAWFATHPDEATLAPDLAP